MTFKQERIIFDGGMCIITFNGERCVLTPEEPASSVKQVYGEAGYKLMKEEEYLTAIAEEGWKLHTANYCVLGKQEAHYFLFVKEA